MLSFIEMAKTYNCHQQNALTRYLQYAGMPLIFFSFMILFSFLHLKIPNYFSCTLAELLTLLLFLYYVLLNWRLAFSLAPVLIILLWLSDLIGHDGPSARALTIFIVTFILGWAVQLIVDWLKDTRPNVIHYPWRVLIAPMVITADVYFRFGKMQTLKKQIRGDCEKPQTSTLNKPHLKNKD